MKHDKKKQWLSIGLLTLGAAALAVFAAATLDAAANTAPSPLRETLSAMAQQDRCHAQAVRNLLACLLG